MEVKIDRTFQKDAAKIDQKALFNLIADSIINVRDASRINEIKNLKKLKGTANHYRIKIGDYRLGIIISKGSVKFIRCLHRKDIYKYFPG
ncbi:MAG: type II toxin-antitoxin system RelE/ParE family toxin [Bacteroidetes bacterium]|nr:type II toxin-antitoxin system RelE/ParE family toxin [Bacteroidota bacterium]